MCAAAHACVVYCRLLVAVLIMCGTRHMYEPSLNYKLQVPLLMSTSLCS